MHTSNIDPKQIGYSWVPPGIVTSSKIQKYFDLLPKEKVPKIGSVGERYRIRQLNYQLPKQDIDYAYCKHVGLDKECFEEFVTTRNEIALDVGYIRECGTNTACANCKEQINQSELAVNATKFSNRVIWHPRCFQCCVCNELLADLTYCAFEEKIFCERHYAEIFKPRCNACDEGTADKPSSKTSHEKDDEYASVSHACESIDERITEENPDVVHEPNHMIKKVDNLPNLNHYFNDALMSEVEETNKYNVDTPMTPMSVDKQFDYLDTKSRDARSSTVYSRSDSDSSSLYRKSNSRDSSSNTEYDYPRYDRTDSTNSFIQDELDSEEYHHHHRFSMTAEALEYIRGRDDWRDHTENILNNRYRRQSSNIRIREQIDSDEYHHDRKLSDLVEIAYLDAETIKSLPSSFNEGDMFDRYYLELQQIKGQLSNDIEQNVAQKQVILLDSSEIETAEGYVYPLPDIILDQVSDNDDETYAVEQIDSDYSNLSESEDDIQSVIEVNHSNSYEGEVITTLNMDGDDDELIEVTLWDIHDDITIEHSSKESSVEIISLPNEYQIGDQIFELETAGNTSEVMSESIESNNLRQIANKDITSNTATDALSEQSKNSNIETGQDASKKDVKKPKRVGFALENNAGIEVQTATNDSKNSNTLQEESQTKSESSSQVEDKLLGAVRQNINQRSTSAGMESSKSFIAHESSTSAQESSRHTTKTAETPKIVAERKKEIDDLIKEGSMGVWFH